MGNVLDSIDFECISTYQLEGLLVTFNGCLCFLLLSRAHTLVIPVVSIPEYLLPLLGIESLP